MPTKSGSRNRIFSACTTCQSRRVKCTKRPGESRCEQCQRGNTECLLRPDGRRRPISRAEVDGLRSRLQSLESMMLTRSQSDYLTGSPASVENSSEDEQQATTLPPPSSVSYSTTTESAIDPSILPPRTTGSCESAAITVLCPDFDIDMDFNTDQNLDCNDIPASFSLPATLTTESSKTLINRIISPSDSVLYDPTSGRLRHSCPLAFHQISELGRDNHDSSSREQLRRVERLLRELSPDTLKHLTESFWYYYNPIMQVVDRESFERGEAMKESLTYSGFLHICVLAMGWRYADPKRSDIQKLAISNKESTLHREAKYLVEFEFESPGGIPSVQALLILGQLESGCGRDAVGWLYAGMGLRCALDIGLHLDCSALNLPQKERDARTFVLRACAAFDRLWAIYLGRSTYLRSADINSHLFPQSIQDCNSSIAELLFSTTNKMEKECFGALLELLDLTVNIVELLYSKRSPVKGANHLVVAELDNSLKTWYSQLPDSLKWAQPNTEKAPLCYFHLHSQFHASVVLLHRPFATYHYPRFELNGNGSATLMESLASISRAICIETSSKLVKVLTIQFQYFDPLRSPQAQLQHIGLAVATLISSIAVSTNVDERSKLLESLHILADLARSVSPTYTPAEMISDVLENLFKEPGWGKDFVTSKGIELPSDLSLNLASEGTVNWKNGALSPELPSDRYHAEKNAAFNAFHAGDGFDYENGETLSRLLDTVTQVSDLYCPGL